MSDLARRLMEQGASIEEVFLAEARERVRDAESILESGFPRPGTEALSRLYRHAHSLTGSASALGLERVADLSRDVAERVAPYEKDSPAVPDVEKERVVRDIEDIHKELEEWATRVGDSARSARS